MVDRARALAMSQLESALPRRWRHVEAVARKAEGLAGVLFDDPDRPVVVASAWLHDVGYAPAAVQTGLHALDGALWLRQQGFDERVIGLVAHHSCAQLEAAERGLLGALNREFVREESAVADALWYCDMTTG